VSTINYTPQTPTNRDFQPLCETYEKLKKSEKLLKKLGLLDNKYLLKRSNTYYFVIKINNSVIKKSLHTSNFVYSNSEVLGGKG